VYVFIKSKTKIKSRVVFHRFFRFYFFYPVSWGGAGGYCHISVIPNPACLLVKCVILKNNTNYILYYCYNSIKYKNITLLVSNIPQVCKFFRNNLRNMDINHPGNPQKYIQATLDTVLSSVDGVKRSLEDGSNKVRLPNQKVILYEK